MKKSILREIESNINFRIKDGATAQWYHERLYVLIIPPDGSLFWSKTYTSLDLDGLEPQEIGRLVKDDYEKFIISQHIYC